MANSGNVSVIYQSVLGLFLIGLTTLPLAIGDDVTVVSINRKVPAKRLTCWICQHSRSSPNSNCINMKNQTDIAQVTCHLLEPFCRVRKLMKDDHVELLERSCAQSCDPGCEKKINKVQACTSCCVHQLCNTGNSGIQVIPPLLTVAASVLLTLLLKHSIGV